LTDLLDNVTFTDVANSIDRLKCNLSAGPDGIHPMLFKKLKYCISQGGVATLVSKGMVAIFMHVVFESSSFEQLKSFEIR